MLYLLDSVIACIYRADVVVFTFTVYVQLPFTLNFIEQFRLNPSSWKFMLVKQQAYSQLLTLGESHLNQDHLILNYAGKHCRGLACNLNECVFKKRLLTTECGYRQINKFN